MQLYESLTGKDYIYSGDNKPVKPHRGITVKVIWRDDNENIFREEIVYRDYGEGKVMARPAKSFTLDAYPLPPGDYTVSVQTIDGDPRFDGFKTAICSGYIVK
ncbi:hypothetical protein B0G80_0703 [Paraburkholderia sp. BL6669N2]|nr:hypothetical protein B0G80_0703 [Paraburkholderia sp. BL6669N2]